MPRRYFNWKLAIVLTISIIVFVVTAFGLRQWRKANSAEQGLTLGIKAYDEHRWEEAARELGRYIAVNQEDVSVLLKYADAQLKIRPTSQGRIQQAVSAYRAVLRIERGNIEAATQLTEIYLSMGMPGEAELIAQRQLEIERRLEIAQTPDIRRMFAIALVQQRKFDEAATELKAICAEDPEQILAYEVLGQLAERQQELFQEPAIYWFDEAVKNNPSSALAYLIRAGFYRRNKDRSQALADLSRAERQDLSDSTIRLRLATEFISLNLLDRAEQHLEEVRAVSPEDQGLWQILAQLALISQSQEQMLKIAEDGLKELSSQPWDFMPLATELYIHSGKLDRAADCISQLHQQDIAPAVVEYLEGLMAVEKGCQTLERIDRFR
jgi:predicted Zn-dependent protease